VTHKRYRHRQLISSLSFFLIRLTERNCEQDAQMKLKRNCGKCRWISPNNSPNLNDMELSCLGSDAWTYFETFVRSPKQFLNSIYCLLPVIWWIKIFITSRTGKHMGQFSAGQINEAVQNFRNSLTTVRESRRKTVWAFFSTQKVFTLSVFVPSWIVETVFDNLSTAKLSWLKAMQFYQFCR